ncbi:MAG: radical SAM protein [Candidatus Aenigmarchaeota archaeon]|nr:radical SAM protein [Candidatus Aenigmarchaeota archaeon]
MKPPGIKGWNFSQEAIRKAVESDKMLLIDVETSNVCNMRCPYCYRDVYGEKYPLKNELSLEERFSIIDQAFDVGCKSIKIPGAGEPLLDPLVWNQIEYARRKDMDVILFTNGLLLTESVVRRLKKLSVSVIIKFNSFRREVEDRIVGMPGYFDRRNEKLEMLIEEGFNRKTPTMLGIDTVITRFNKEEIIRIFRFCRDNNIFPIIKPFMPVGGALRVLDWQIPFKEVLKLYKQAWEIDRKEYGFDYPFSLTYIGAPCDQRKYALFVDILGNVYFCTGNNQKLGNVRETSLKEIWFREDVKRVRRMDYSVCPPRKAFWLKSGYMPKSMEEMFLKV